MTTRRCESLDGATLTYGVESDGPTVMLLHGGFVQNRSAWHDAGWSAALAREHRVLSIDLRGHGVAVARRYGINGVLGLSLLKQFNCEIRSVEGRILIDRVPS